jgi:hypothetical protein
VREHAGEERTIDRVGILPFEPGDDELRAVYRKSATRPMTDPAQIARSGWSESSSFLRPRKNRSNNAISIPASHSQLKTSSPRCQCIRRLVVSVLPTTRNANGAAAVNGATPADITQFIAEPPRSSRRR